MSFMTRSAYMTRTDFAKLIGVPAYVLRRWDESGKLPAYEKSDGGGRSYYVEAQLKRALELKLVYEANRERVKGNK